MKDTFVIGIVAKPQGVRGELKITPYTDNMDIFSNLRSVIIDDKTYSVTRSKSCGSFAVISILGINDRNTAELFRNKEIVVPRKDGQKLSKDSYYIVDIIGSSLTTEDGEILGKITDVTKAKTDIFTVKTVDGRILRFPFLKDLLVLVDVEKSIMTVKRQRLFEVSVYED